MKVREAFRRDWWKLLICVAALAYAIYDRRGVIAFFAIGALIAWPVFRLSQKDDERDWW